MTAKLYSTFDPANLGPNLVLEQANTILLTDTASTNSDRAALCLYGKDSGQWFAEFSAWGVDAIDGVYIGIAKSSVTLIRNVGRTADSYGYRLSDGAGAGNIYHSSLVPIATVDECVAGDIIGVWVNIGDGTAPEVTWYRNGIPQYTASLVDSGPWYPAATTSGATAGGMKVWINTGQRDFEYPVPGAPGWFTLPEALPAILLSTDDYISPHDDTLQDQVWDGMIADDGVEIVSELRFWVDGSGRATQGSSTSVPVAHAGELDWLIGADTRDLTADLETVETRGSYDSAQSIAKMIVDSITVTDQGTLRITLVSTMAQLSDPLQTKIFPPSADPVVAGKPWPIALGAARQVTPVVVDPVNRIFALTDQGIVGIGYVRVSGAPLDPSAGPPDYVLGDDYRTIVLETDPVGKLTADVSNIGGSVPPTLSEDIWLSYGNPFTDNAGVPANFDVQSNATYAAAGKCVLTSPGLAGVAYVSLSTATCTEGRSYRYRVELATVPGTHAYGTPTVSISTSSGMPIVVWTAAGIYEGIFTAQYSFTPRLILRDALTSSASVINKAYILEIPDTYDPAEIQPITLTDFAREILENRAGRSVDSWSLADTTAIDTDTGYAGSGFYASSAMTLRDPMDMVMIGYTGCAWVDSLNVVRFTRLLDPAGETPVGEITEDDLLSELQVKPDNAPGLTTQMQFRKNWTAMTDTDFVSDYVTVPGSVRRALSQPYQGIVASALPLPSMYSHAVYADPIGVLLDVEADAQAEIDRIVGYYGTPRFFYTVEVSDEDFVCELGQVWTLTNSRYGLDAGKPLQICKIIRRPIAGSKQITLRG